MVRCLRRRKGAAGGAVSPAVSPASSPDKDGGSPQKPARSRSRMEVYRGQMDAASLELESQAAAAAVEGEREAVAAAQSAEAAAAFAADLAAVQANDASLGTELRWCDRGVTAAELKSLAQALPGNDRLLSLDISWNSLTAADVRPLIAGLCACGIAAVNISATAAGNDFTTQTALQELCAPRYLKLLKANHPALHTLHVPAVFHAEFGDEEADQLAEALERNDHLLHILAGHAGAELTEVGISHIEGAIARSPGHATFEHQGHVHVNVLGSTKVQERGSRTDVPVSSRVRTLQVEPEPDDDADGSPLKPKQEDRPKVPAYAILTVRAAAHFLGSPPRLPSR